MGRHFLVFIHLLGLVLFLGSIFGHIVASALGGAPGASAGFVTARQHIALATAWLTLPGLGAAVLSGLGLALVSRRSRLPRWVWWYGGLALVVVGVVCAVVVPAGGRALSGALALTQHDITASLAAVKNAKRVEDVAGAFNVLLTLLVIGLAVARPRMRHAKPAAPGWRQP